LGTAENILAIKPLGIGSSPKATTQFDYKTGKVTSYLSHRLYYKIHMVLSCELSSGWKNTRETISYFEVY
jgi:hypothetical protein